MVISSHFQILHLLEVMILRIWMNTIFLHMNMIQKKIPLMGKADNTILVLLFM